MGSKARDFLIIKEIYKKMSAKEHHTKKTRQGLYEIMSLSLALHPETRVRDHTLKLLAEEFTEKEKALFTLEFSDKYSQFLKEASEILLTQVNMNPYFISGLILGDGCLGIRLTANGYIGFFLTFGQSKSSSIMCKIILDFFSSTNEISVTEGKVETFQKIAITDLKTIEHRIIPHFDKYPL